jgi:hypothetical protein
MSCSISTQSISSGAHYMNLQGTIRMKESQNMRVSLRKLVLLSNNAIVFSHCLQWMAQVQQHY